MYSNKLCTCAVNNITKTQNRLVMRRELIITTVLCVLSGRIFSQLSPTKQYKLPWISVVTLRSAKRKSVRKILKITIWMVVLHFSFFFLTVANYIRLLLSYVLLKHISKFRFVRWQHCFFCFVSHHILFVICFPSEDENNYRMKSVNSFFAFSLQIKYSYR